MIRVNHIHRYINIYIERDRYPPSRIVRMMIMMIRSLRHRQQQQQQQSCVRSCYSRTMIPYLLVALYCMHHQYHGSNNNKSGSASSILVHAYTYNSVPFLYVNEQQQATNATFPIQEHLPSKVKNDMNDRPDFLYHPKPGEYRVVEYYVHCTYLERISMCICMIRV